MLPKHECIHLSNSMVVRLCYDVISFPIDIDCIIYSLIVCDDMTILYVTQWYIVVPRLSSS